MVRSLRVLARELDVPLVAAALVLSVIGVVLVWSATAAQSGAAYLVRGGINLAVALVLAAVTMATPQRRILTFGPLAYLGACLLLLAVLSPLGSTVNGSRSWIQLPGFSIQPAELAKVTLALALALVFSQHRSSPLVSERRLGARRLTTRSAALQVTVSHGAPWRVVRNAAVVAAVPLALVMLQPDLGSALVLLSLIWASVAAARVAGWLLWSAFFTLVAGAVVALTTPVLAGYQRSRLTVFLHPDLDPSGIGYQVQQVKVAIGAGGFLGQGLFRGHSTQGGFIPFQYTDFVFSVAGEELGFLGALAIVVAEATIVWRLLIIARRSRDDFGRVLCCGLAGWFAFQACENIGMNLALMPVTGVPLPFVSYGGSSLFAAWIAIGLAANSDVSSRLRLS